MEIAHHQYIVKIFELSLIRKMIDYMKRGRKHSFKNEINFYKGLSNRIFPTFQYPKLIKTDGRNYLMIEYIEGSKGWDPEDISKEKLIQALLEFQFSDIEIKTNLIKRLYSNWCNKIPCRIFRWAFLIIHSTRDFITALHCIYLAFISIVLLRPTKPILVHNDLFNFNNLITGVNQKLYFYDFEYVMKEKKWILIDILDLSFDLATLTVRTDLLAEYFSQISADPIIGQYIQKNAAALIRVILIRKLLGAIILLSMENSLELQYKEFLAVTLLHKKQYQSWFRNNIKTYVTHVPIDQTGHRYSFK